MTKALVGPILCAASAALAFAFATAAAAQPSPAEASLLQAEDQLFAADVHHDTTAMARGFADEAVFVHANGAVQTKAEYIRAAQSGGPPITAVEASNRVAHVFGNVGVVRGDKTVVLGAMRLAGSYLTVYVMRDGRWQMLDEQSSPAPRNDPAH